jgi:hypothetical protein
MIRERIEDRISPGISGLAGDLARHRRLGASTNARADDQHAYGAVPVNRAAGPERRHAAREADSSHQSSQGDYDFLPQCRPSQDHG